MHLRRWLRWPRHTWQAPEVGPGDRLVETVIVHADGKHHPIVLHVGANGVVRGFNHPIDLPPGAAIAIPVSWRHLPVPRHHLP